LQETDDRAINLDPSQPSVSLIAHAAQSSLSNHPASDVYLDSGATQHMFHQRSRFSNFKPIPSGGKSIEGIGNSRVEIRGIGDVTFNASVNGATQPITFYNSLFAPELGINLISVSCQSIDFFFRDNLLVPLSQWTLFVAFVKKSMVKKLPSNPTLACGK